MHVVVTGSYMFDSGDVSWAAVKAIKGLNITWYERTLPEELPQRGADADILLINKTAVSREAMDAMPHLKLISVVATGYNMIDIKAAREKNITVCNVPAYGTASVAQHTFALILELANHVGLHAASVANGDWARSPEWCYNIRPVIGLAGKTLGIVGFGNIGRQTAAIGGAFGMKVIYNGPNKKDSTTAAFVSIKELFAQSDVISLHCPLTPQNNKFLNAQLLALMKPTAMLINTSRGLLIDEDALANALNSGAIAGAAVDVLSTEPPASSNPLLAAKNCIITPHIAWMSLEARQRILDVTALNIQSFLDGKPVNVVNPIP